MNSEVSTTESQPETSETSRLGKCEVCAVNDAKYSCPKCEVKTCRLECLKIHKKELECDGIRDRTKYIPLKKMTQMDFMNDYYFLEECTRYVGDRKRDKIKRFSRYSRDLPIHLTRLQAACWNRKIRLRYLLLNFTKRNTNTTKLDYATQIIYWKVEWIFPNVGEKSLAFVDDQCSENDPLTKLLDKYFNPESEIDCPGRKQLEYYQSRGIDKVRILLKAEGVRRCKDKYYELEVKSNLKTNLKGKTLVEYPTIYIVFDECAREFDVIQSDDECEEEKRRYDAILKGSKDVTSNKKKRKHQEVEPKNYFFMDETQENMYESSTDEDQPKNEMDTKGS